MLKVVLHRNQRRPKVPAQAIIILDQPEADRHDQRRGCLGSIASFLSPFAERSSLSIMVRIKPIRLAPTAKTSVNVLRRRLWTPWDRDY
jgi:hypothetical protein